MSRNETVIHTVSELYIKLYIFFVGTPRYWQEPIGIKKPRKARLGGATRNFGELRGKVNGGDGGDRTRVRKTSTPGSTCLAPSLFLAFSYPTVRVWKQRSRYVSPCWSGLPAGLACVVCLFATDHRRSGVNSSRVLRPRVRSCRRSQLTFLPHFLRGRVTSSTCTWSFATSVEAMSSPVIE